MHVGMSGHGPCRTAQVIDSLIELAKLLEGATQVIARDSVQGINLHRSQKSVSCVGELSQLIVSNAQIYVRFDPTRRQFHDALVIFDRFRQCLAASFAIQRGLKKILGRRSGHRVQFRGLRRHIVRERPLAQKGIEGCFRSWRYHMYVAAQLDHAQFLNWQGLVPKLFFDQCDGAPHPARRDTILRQILDGSHSNQVAETVKTLAPARFRPYQPQSFPVTKTARLQPQNAPNFTSCITLSQAEEPPPLLFDTSDYAPAVNPAPWYRPVNNSAPVDNLQSLRQRR